MRELTLLLSHPQDAFFAQVEAKRDPSLKEKAFAVQQHQDIVAVSVLCRHSCAQTACQLTLSAAGELQSQGCRRAQAHAAAAGIRKHLLSRPSAAACASIIVPCRRERCCSP